MDGWNDACCTPKRPEAGAVCAACAARDRCIRCWLKGGVLRGGVRALQGRATMKQGAQADRSNRRVPARAHAALGEAALHSATLAGADLRPANLQRANRSAATLSTAPRRGTRGQEAHGPGADRTDATGLCTRHRAGTASAKAHVPAAGRPCTAMETVKERADSAHHVVRALCVGWVSGWLRLATTSAVQLLTTSASSALPLVHTSMPPLAVFWVAPVLLLCLYGYVRRSRQRLGDRLAALPAVCPAGSPFSQRDSAWLLHGLVSRPLMPRRKRRPPWTRGQPWRSRVRAGGRVPMPGLRFCMRSLPRQERAGTPCHVLGRGQARGWGRRGDVQARVTLPGRVLTGYQHGRGVVVSAIGLCVGLVGLASGAGQPREPALPEGLYRDRVASGCVEDLASRCATAHFLAADVSITPPHGTGKTAEDMAGVPGARLGHAGLPCAKARRALLVPAALRGATLVSADCRDTTLAGATCLGAALEDATRQGATLREAVGRTPLQRRAARNTTVA